MHNTFAVICHDRRKLRLISAAPFRDRVVHHVLCRVLEPIWERRLIHDTYACRPDKGTHAALGRCEMFARRYRYVLQCDVHQFFPAIDHAILQQKLARVVTCPRTLALIERILAGGADVLAPVYEVEWFPGDDLLSPLRPRGLPIGNLTSQFWANIYLDSLDQYVKRELKCAGYVRYRDDFLHHRRLRSDNVRLTRRRLVAQHRAVQARRMSHARFQEADVLLDSLRLQVRLAHELRCLSLAQYEHASRLLAEIGRLLGAWRKMEVSGTISPSGADPAGAVRLSQQEQP